MTQNYIEIIKNIWIQGNSVDALILINQLTLENPNEDKYLNIAAEMYFEIKEWEKCIENINKIKEKTVDNNNMLAIVYYYIGEKIVAEKIFHENINKNNDNNAKINLISLYLREKNIKKAEELIETINYDLCDIDGLNTIGNYWVKKNNPDKAIKYFLKAITEKSNYIPALKNLADIYLNTGKIYEANELYENIEKININYEGINELILLSKMKMCSWNDLATRFDKINLNKSCLPLLYLSLNDNPEDQLINIRNYLNKKYSNIKSNKKEKNKKQREKIKIGYISNDFKNHATSYLMAGLIKNHNKNIFHVYCIHLGEIIDDEMQNKMREFSTNFYYAENDKDILLKILKDLELDIAIDLNFVTQNNIVEVFLERIAPIQINFLGYPGTSGIDSYDYIIGDKYLINQENEKFITENKILLNCCYQPNYSDKYYNLNYSTRQENNLPENVIVFASFNQTNKITPFIFKAWMEILLGVEDAVLWLLYDNDESLENLKKEAAQIGINENRIIGAPRVNIKEHLARIPNANIVLDTFPYGAHTTASDVLCMKVPIVTISGQSFVSRVCGSILTEIGVKELIVHDIENYISTALKLAEDKDYYELILKKIVEGVNSSNILNSENFAKEIERHFELIFNENI
jgi:protein O-GlcNAc transferase